MMTSLFLFPFCNTYVESKSKVQSINQKRGSDKFIHSHFLLLFVANWSVFVEIKSGERDDWLLETQSCNFNSLPYTGCFWMPRRRRPLQRSPIIDPRHCNRQHRQPKLLLVRDCARLPFVHRGGGPSPSSVSTKLSASVDSPPSDLRSKQCHQQTWICYRNGVEKRLSASLKTTWMDRKAMCMVTGQSQAYKMRTSSVWPNRYVQYTHPRETSMDSLVA